MFARLHAQWDALAASRPGCRFEDRYRRNKRSSEDSRLLWRVVRVIAAAVLIAIGVVFVFIPGPAILFFLLAGGLLSTDSLALARALDWSEVRVRRIATVLGRWWRRRSFGAKVAVGSLGVCLSAAGMLLAYRLVLR